MYTTEGETFEKFYWRTPMSDGGRGSTGRLWVSVHVSCTGEAEMASETRGSVRLGLRLARTAILTRTIMHTRLQDMWGAQPPLRNRCLCHATRSAQVCMGNTPNTHLLDAGETIAYRFRPHCLSPRNDVSTKYTIWVLYFVPFVLRSVLWIDRTYRDLG